MNEKHTYRAHRIDLVLLETMRGRYRWIAFVDGGQMGVGPEALVPLAEARQQALRFAHTMIDAFEARRSADAPPPLHETTGALAPVAEPVGAIRPGAA